MSYAFVLNRELGKDVPLSDSIAAAYEKNYKLPGLFLAGEDKANVQIMNGSFSDFHSARHLNGAGW